MATPTGETPTRARRKKRFFLYWCTTEDADEDWFVVADSARAARRYHERAEGYGKLVPRKAAEAAQLTSSAVPDGASG